ncbi:MAG: hypothetical protein PHC36_09340, partial [Eubacteriales bacterium]|nr:hypothetical protein [Eubacteriales bacterium]
PCSRSIPTPDRKLPRGWWKDECFASTADITAYVTAMKNDVPAALAAERRVGKTTQVEGVNKS